MTLGASLNLPDSLSLADETARIQWFIQHIAPMPVRVGYYAWSVFKDPFGQPDYSRVDRISNAFYRAGFTVYWDYSPDPQPNQPGWVALNGGASWPDWWTMPERIVPIAKARFQDAINHEVSKLDALGLSHNRCGWFVGNERTGGSPQAPKGTAPGVFADSTHNWLDQFATVDFKGTASRGPAICMFGGANESTELATMLGHWERTWRAMLTPVVNLRVQLPKGAPFRDAAGNPSNWYAWVKKEADRLGWALWKNDIPNVTLSEVYSTPADYNSLIPNDRSDACAGLVSALRDSGAIDLAMPFTPGFAPQSVNADKSDDYALFGTPFLSACAAMKVATV